MLNVNYAEYYKDSKNSIILSLKMSLLVNHRIKKWQTNGSSCKFVG